MVKQAGWIGLGFKSIGLRVKRVTGQKQIILSRLKMCLGQSGCRLGRVDLYFSHKLYIYIYI